MLIKEEYTISIKSIVPTSRPELIFRLSNDTCRILSYNDLIGHKPFVPPNEWHLFSYNTTELRFKRGLVLSIDWIVENTKEVDINEISHRSLVITEKHYSSGAFFGVSLFPFTEDFLGVAETDDFRGGMGGSAAYNLQDLQDKKNWREICSKAGGDWLIILFDSRKEWSKDAFIDEIIKKVTGNI